MVAVDEGSLSSSHRALGMETTAILDFLAVRNAYSIFTIALDLYLLHTELVCMFSRVILLCMVK